MNILITGGTGFVGRELVKYLNQQSHRVIIASRRFGQVQEDAGFTNIPAEGELFSPDMIRQLDAVINLAGHNIADGRWTLKTKERILSSRVQITRQLVESIQRNRSTDADYPKILLNASAVGYYGFHPTAVFNEESPSGQGFLAGVCREWEKEARRAEELGVRVACFRLGVVLGPEGGVLKKIALPYRYGLGGTIGDGKQWSSWVHIDDVVNVFSVGLIDERFRGAYNLCSPQAVTMSELNHSLAGILGKKSWTRLPGFIARILLGEMAEELLLNGQRVKPKKLLKMGYTFKYPDITSALAASI